MACLSLTGNSLAECSDKLRRFVVGYNLRPVGWSEILFMALASQSWGQDQIYLELLIFFCLSMPQIQQSEEEEALWLNWSQPADPCDL